MLMRVWIVAILIVAAMVGVKQGWLLRNSGLTGSCRLVSSAADGSSLTACRAGKLEGAPNLASHGCVLVNQPGSLNYWRCSAPIVASQAGR